MDARCIYPAATRGIVPNAVGMCPAMTRGVFSCLGSGEEKLVRRERWSCQASMLPYIIEALCECQSGCPGAGSWFVGTVKGIQAGRAGVG